MKVLLALVVGFLIALVLFMLSPVLRDLANKGRQRFYLWQLQLSARILTATMALPADQPVRSTGMPLSDVSALTTEFTKLVTQFRALCTKLDADAGVTDANYSSTLAAADAASPAKIIASF